MKQINYVLIIFTFIIFISCIDKYEPKTIGFEDILVVESTLTNEYKKQQVKLSRVIPIDSILPDSEKNALIQVQASNGNNYSFNEIEAGTYESEIPFKAEPNITYQLLIDTEDGEHFQSTKEKLTPIAPVDLSTERLTLNTSEKGIQVFSKTSENSEAKYFRYEYDETYKVVTPYLVTLDGSIVDYYFTNECPIDHYRVQLETSNIEKHICYVQDNQKEILLANKEKAKKMPLLFLQNNYKIRERYSILIKQYSINLETYNYYKIIKKLESVDNLLSQIQTGYVTGNISTENNKKVIGYFSVNALSEKRIFFNFNDFDLPYPNYEFDCNKYTWDYNKFSCHGVGEPDRLLIYQVLTDEFKKHEVLYVDLWGPHDDFPLAGNLPLIITFVNSECGNCTNFASNIRPDYWED